MGGLPSWLSGKKSSCIAGDARLMSRLGRSPGEGNSNHSSILAWQIPWTEDPGVHGFAKESDIT